MSKQSKLRPVEWENGTVLSIRCFSVKAWSILTGYGGRGEIHFASAEVNAPAKSSLDGEAVTGEVQTILGSFSSKRECVEYALDANFGSIVQANERLGWPIKPTDWVKKIKQKTSKDVCFKDALFLDDSSLRLLSTAELVTIVGMQDEILQALHSSMAKNVQYPFVPLCCWTVHRKKAPNIEALLRKIPTVTPSTVPRTSPMLDFSVKIWGLIDEFVGPERRPVVMEDNNMPLNVVGYSPSDGNVGKNACVGNRKLLAPEDVENPEYFGIGMSVVSNVGNIGHAISQCRDDRSIEELAEDWKTLSPELESKLQPAFWVEKAQNIKLQVEVEEDEDGWVLMNAKSDFVVKPSEYPDKPTLGQLRHFLNEQVQMLRELSQFPPCTDPDRMIIRHCNSYMLEPTKKTREIAYGVCQVQQE